MKTITRDELKRKIEENGDFALVEVLDKKYFDKYHLPGAINVPADEHFEEAIQEAVPDKDTPVVVYCLNTQCSASPRAARQLDHLGYAEVYDYEAGKEDWKEAGLPTES